MKTEKTASSIYFGPVDLCKSRNYGRKVPNRKTQFDIIHAMHLKFGKVTTSELEVMLTASAESGTAPLAVSLLAKLSPAGFDATRTEAEYLRDQFLGDSGRVAEACGEAAGRAFENAGMKIAAVLR